MTEPRPIVPVLLTADVDYSRHHAPEAKQAAFDVILARFAELRIASTFYFVAREAEQVGSLAQAVTASGHEVGCHGLTHAEDDEYSTLLEAEQELRLREATGILRNLAGTPIVSFRAPRVKISAPTYQVLVRLGYLTDSSVCSQRFDLVSSNLVNTGWLRAPRRPYHPRPDDPYGRGSSPLLVVPISAIALPFISSALYALGLGPMKAFFRLLRLESLRTGKPIVYLYHPYEFAAEIPGARDYSRNLRVHGLRFRRHLYRGTPADKLQWTMGLCRYMQGFPDVRFMTMRTFHEHYSAAGH